MNNDMQYLHKEGYNIGDGRTRLTGDEAGWRSCMVVGDVIEVSHAQERIV